MTTVVFDTHAQTLAQLIEGELATKRDLKELEIALRHELKEMESRITLRLGGLIVAGMGVLAVLMRIL